MKAESRRPHPTLVARSDHGSAKAVDRGGLARNSKSAFLEERPCTVSCDPWSVHSLSLFLRGSDTEEAVEAIHTLLPAAVIVPIPWTDRATGEVKTSAAFIHLDFTCPDTAALLPLSAVSQQLASFPWEQFPGLRVNRVDLASDHLVRSDPKRVCGRIGDLHLPYSSTYRGPADAHESWLTVYHRGGKKARAWKTQVAHYPRLESLLRHPDAATAAIEYCRQRVRQEVRFRGQGLRRRLGGGPMTLEIVLASFPLLVEFAERRLRPVFEAGVLSPPPRDLVGEAALASVVGFEASGRSSQFRGSRQ
jgi:hypothetical protein